MSKKDERKFVSDINKNRVLIIKKPDYIKAMPLTFPGSGLNIIFNDRNSHHYSIYDENHKKTRMYLKGYSDKGELFVCSGQNTFKINPDIKEIEMIPSDNIPKLNYFMASGNLHVEVPAEGYVVYIKKYRKIVTGITDDAVKKEDV